ncbi:GNAT family N-acetyltransferase [bacterium]|nr:GNAT family N-acetyltransferase [bacterium]
MNVSTVQTEAEWLALEGEWGRMVERCTASAFLTMEWLAPWWRHLRRAGDRLAILVAREDDDVIGLAPLYRSRVSAYGLGSVERVGFIGDSSGDSEYLDFLVEPGRESDVLSAFFDHMDGWDVAEFRLLPIASPNVPVLRVLAAERGWRLVEDEAPCSSVPLPATWDEFLGTLQSRFRGKVRALLRRIPAEHDGEFLECARQEDVAERLPSLFEMHQRRWRAEGRPGSFASGARRDFYAELAARLLARGWLRFASLRLGDRWVAHEFSFEHRGRVYYLQQGYEADCGKLSVGIALKAHVIRESIARDAREYDFLGGVAAHKEKWGAQPKACVHVALAKAGLRARWRLWLPRFAARMRDRGRALTPAALLRWKRGLQERLRERRARQD